MHIYIPLCLYFNRYGTLQNGIVVKFTFHYVSILIFTRCGRGYAICRIYIPLCLYFNVCCQIVSRLSHVFTFHYVSILIVTRLCIYFFPPWFTFHYVSILITVIWLRMLPDLYIYIPLCLYFNRYFCVPCKPTKSKFTFHYVSILISDEQRATGAERHLHSIMSLF